MGLLRTSDISDEASPPPLLAYRLASPRSLEIGELRCAKEPELSGRSLSSFIWCVHDMYHIVIVRGGMPFKGKRQLRIELSIHPNTY